MYDANNRPTTFLRYDNEWEEWQVLYIGLDGRVDEEKTYHTDDYFDAIATRKVIETHITIQYGKDVNNESQS